VIKIANQSPKTSFELPEVLERRQMDLGGERGFSLCHFWFEHL
jgi:hypothetical protein